MCQQFQGFENRMLDRLNQWDIWVGYLDEQRVMGHESQLGVFVRTVVEGEVVTFEFVGDDEGVISWMVGPEMFYGTEGANFVPGDEVVVYANF